MASKKVKIGKSTREGASRIVDRVADYGFPKIEKAISRSTIYRMQEAGETEIICDPACNIKGRKNMAKAFKERFDKYGFEKQIARLEEVKAPHIEKGLPPEGLPHVKLGPRITFYCITSAFWWLENLYRPYVKKKKASNFDNKTGITWTDP